jgi:hypothetical protein
MKRKKFKKLESVTVDGRIVHPARHVLKLFDLEPERFRKWIEAGYIKPDVKAKGTGSTHYFLKEHLYVIGVFMKLVDAGLNRQISSEAAYSLKKGDWPDISFWFRKNCYMVMVGDVNPKKDRNWKKKMAVYISDGPRLGLDTFKRKTDFELAVLVNLHKIASYVDSRIE